jgi:hypothetical protein
MTTFSKRLAVAAVAGVALWALSGHPAYGQAAAPVVTPFGNAAMGGIPPGFNANFGMGMAATTPFNPAMAGLNPALGGGSITSVTPYGGSGYGASGYPGSGYYPPYYPNPYYVEINPLGDTLKGAAMAINAQGQFNISNQQAKLLNEQYKQMRIDTRRKIYEEWLWERANTPTLQDMREEMQKLELRRALKDPPIQEVLSATALNNIFNDLKAKQLAGARGTAIPVDEGVLKQVNLTGNPGTGNIGVLKGLKDGGTLHWPLVLTGEAYKRERDKVDRLAGDAVKLAEFKGEVDPGSLRDMQNNIRGLQAAVSANLNDMTPTQSIEARRFLNQLDDAVKALQQPNVADYFTQKMAAQGKTVPELIDYMAKRGLSFAPSSGGDEAAYMAMHNYLAGYANSLQNQAAAAGGNKEKD